MAPNARVIKKKRRSVKASVVAMRVLHSDNECQNMEHDLDIQRQVADYF